MRTRWRKNLPAAIFCLVGLCLPAAGQPVSPERSSRSRSAESDRRALVSLENEWLRGLNDAGALDKILAPDFVHPVPTGDFLTKAQHVAYATRHAPPADLTRTFDNLTVRLYGDAGIVNGVVVSRDRRGSVVSRSVFTDVFARRDGRWQAVNAQENRVEEPAGGPPRAASPETVAWFQRTEQALMDSIAVGDKSVWDRVMDPDCIVTSEEGEVTGKKRFLEDFGPLPPGLAGKIAVRDLTVQEFPGFAVVRYLADEWESVFGHELTTKYRTTDTYRRRGSDWKMVASHTAVVTQDPPPQKVSTSGWPALAGTYRLQPNGWTFTVALEDGQLFGGRDPKKLRPFIPLAPDAFVLSGSLGEWIFVRDDGGRVTHILDFRKFEPLVWSRIDAPR